MLPAALLACREPPPSHRDRTDTDTVDTVTGSTAATGETAEPTPPLRWVSISMGYVHACGLLSDGRVVCWGAEDTAVPPSGPFVGLSVDEWYGCGLRPDHTVTCWPAGAHGYPWGEVVTDAPARRDLVAVKVVEDAACAEDEGRRLHCWGRRTVSGGAPTSPVAAWDIEDDLGCAVDDGGAVTCWGQTALFTEGTPGTVGAPPADRKYVDVAVGRQNACALDTSGEVVCWGQAYLNVPYPQGPPGPFVSLEAFNQVTCALRADATVACWYDFPQLWDVDDEPPDADGGPPWEPPPGHRWAQIGLGEWDACGVTVDGEGLCWMPQSDTAGEVSELPALADLELP